MRLLLGLGFATALALQAEPANFRTDADGPFTPNAVRKQGKPAGAGDKPDWFQLVEGQFPPPGSAHAIPGELISVDHLERRFAIRVDRNDSQDRGIWDLPLAAAMLPYGAIYYHGAPAALQDIPLGTHLHGLFYLKDPNDKSPLMPTPNNRHTPEADFRRCFQLEDDFTFHSRQKQLWKIDSVDLDTRKLTATLQEKGQPSGAAKTFDLLTATRVMKGEGFADLQALQPGQTVLLNLTWVTLYGPGRITDVWVDEPSRALAMAQQLEKHRNYVREHGLAGWVKAVDDEAQVVTIALFGGIDEKLFDDLGLLNAQTPGAPPLKEGEDPTLSKASIAVARESLMTYDPVNDRRGGPILHVRKVSVEPGTAGLEIDVKCDLMLEGYRPKRIVSVYPGTWKVIALPKEEQFSGRE